MSKVTEISWCDHTFNPWIGCTKVSQGCVKCYADILAQRWYHDVEWVKNGRRHRTTDENWRGVERWDRAAAEAGESARVFCASLADVFEDHPSLPQWRKELFELIERCVHIDWMLLTKRPENVLRMVPKSWLKKWPEHVWIGTSVESADTLHRLDELVRIPAARRFVSIEPILGPVDIWPWVSRRRQGKPLIDLVITGGESGGGSRPSHPDWIRLVRDDCINVGVAFHHKQWGNWGPEAQLTKIQRTNASKKTYAHEDGTVMRRMPKHVAGRLLDGQEWVEMPPRRTFKAPT